MLRDDGQHLFVMKLLQKRERGIYTPLYVLADPNEKKGELLGACNDVNILYITYCLSHDQNWLVASATDHCGDMVESCCINIQVPPR